MSKIKKLADSVSNKLDKLEGIYYIIAISDEEDMTVGCAGSSKLIKYMIDKMGERFDV